jgi:hypothetical protein
MYNCLILLSYVNRRYILCCSLEEAQARAPKPGFTPFNEEKKREIAFWLAAVSRGEIRLPKSNE